MYKYYLLLALLTSLLFSCREKQQVRKDSLPRPVRVARVEALGTITRQYTGVVAPREFSTLAFKIPGTLTELRIRSGQQVKKGDVIARIKPYDYQLQYESARSNYTTAKSIYERNQRLFASNAVARQDLEIAEADYIRARAALHIAGLTLDYTTLTAPFDGFIEQRFADNFEEVGAGQAIARLVNPEGIEIHFSLPETNIQLLQIPGKISVGFDAQKGKLFTSEIKEYIYSSKGLGIPISLIISDEQFAPYRKNIFPGFSCKVFWEIGNTIADQFIIPSSALLQEGGQEFAWVVDPNDMTLHQRPVKAIHFDDQALIQEGITKDDLIVIAGVNSVRKGQKVKIMNDK